MKGTPFDKKELIAMGCICAICNQPLLEEYDRPIACEECGGEAVIDEDGAANE